MITVKRLHELTKAELLSFGTWMRGEIKPESTSIGSTWACQSRQQPHFWSDDYLAELYTDRKRKLNIWVGLKNGQPVGTCWVVDGDPDRSMTQFMVDEGLPLAEQIEVADTIALYAIEDELAAINYPGDLIISYRLDANAEAYADLCGFTKVDVPGPENPRRISFKALRENILRRRRSG